MSFAAPDFITYLERFSAAHCILFAFGLICACWSLEKEDVSPISVHLPQMELLTPKREGGSYCKGQFAPREIIHE